MSASKPPVLTGPLAELQRRGHGGAAVRLVLEWGGTARYIPFEPGAKSPLVGVIGMAAARVLCDIVSRDAGRKRRGQASGVYIDIPSRKALEDTDKGAILRHEGGTRETAQAIGCSERYVREVRNGGQGRGGRPSKARPRDGRQTSLF